MDEAQFAKDLLDKIIEFINTNTDDELAIFSNELIQGTEEIQTIIQDFEIYEDTLERIRKIKEGIDDNWKRFTDRDDCKIYYK